jgi:hypothetical protein
MGNFIFKDCSEKQYIENLNYKEITNKTSPGPPIFNVEISYDNTSIRCSEKLCEI